MTDQHRLDPDQDQRSDEPSAGAQVIGRLSERTDAGTGEQDAGVEPVHDETEARQVEVDQEASAGPSVGDDGQAGFRLS